MRAVFLSLLMVCALAEAGIYYLADEDGNVTRHEGDTPYPAGAVWNSKCPRTADEETLSVVEGVVVVDPAKVNAAAVEAEAQAALPTVFETGIAVVDSEGHHMEFISVADGEPPLSIQISDSPLDKTTRDAKVAAKLAEVAAAKAEREALKDREFDDLKAAIATAKNHKELGAAVVKWIEATEAAE